MLQFGLRALLALLLAQAGCTRFGFDPRRRNGADGAGSPPRDATRDHDAQARYPDAAHSLASDAEAPSPPDLGQPDAATGVPVTTAYFPALEDTNVATGSPDQPRGAAAELTPGYCAAPSNGNMRSWLKFDLSSLPADATILSASLRLVFFAHWGTQDYEIYRSAHDDWSEGTLTWNTQPAYDPEVLATVPAFEEDNVWKSWDLTVAATRELAGDQRLTLVLAGATLFDPSTTPEHHENYARSKEGAGTDTDPILSVTYRR